MNPNPTSDTDVVKAIESAGASFATVAHVGDAVYVSFHIYGGNGFLHEEVCGILVGEYLGSEIVILESPILGEWCKRARIRDAEGGAFYRRSVMATAVRMGIFDNRGIRRHRRSSRPGKCFV